MALKRTSGNVFRSSLQPFDYFEPTSIPETLALLRRFKGKARLMAGGTDLLVGMKKEKFAPKAVINIKNLPTLNFEPRIEKGRIILSPLTTLTDIAESHLLQKKLPMLPDTALLMASPQVRNRATIGGNLCNAAPSADMTAPLMVLGTKVLFNTGKSQKTVPLEGFFRGPGETVLGSTGILLQIQIPLMRKGEEAAYRKHTVRMGMDIAVAGVAVSVLKKGRTIKDIKIALGAVSPTVIRARASENILRGSDVKDELILKAAESASCECCPISDVRATEPYRLEMVKLFMVRALKGILS
ncbi:MAG: xanthine dehydrogenase family protein subunit M [Pseudomonadota bacterium]